MADSNDFRFSRYHLAGLNGNVASDREHLLRYRDACERNVTAAAAAIEAIADGLKPFDQQLLPLLRSQVASIRFHLAVLDEAALQFKRKPELASLFSVVSDRLRPLTERSMQRALEVEGWFEPLTRHDLLEARRLVDARASSTPLSLIKKALEQSKVPYHERESGDGKC